MLCNQGNRQGPSLPSSTHLGTCQTILTWETTVARSTLRRRREEAGGEYGSSLACLEGVPPGPRALSPSPPAAVSVGQ